MKVYIAGPMQGIADSNFPAFDEAKARWEAAGHHVYCPACLSRAVPWEDDPRMFMRLDLSCVMQADAVAVLPGWRDSSGSTVEVALAQFIGIPIYDAMTMAEIKPQRKPWGKMSCN